tara:strand:+ start:708 stop:1088 length:381 start_codon:yes stop_codon:yes gene_type:complete
MLIPKDVQHHFIHGPDKPANLRGKPKRKLKQTLQTDNLNNAEHRKLPIIYFWQELIAKARAAEQGVILDLEAEVEKSQADFRKMGSGDIARQALAEKYFTADRPPTFGKGQDIDPGPMETDDEKRN